MVQRSNRRLVTEAAPATTYAPRREADRLVGFFAALTQRDTAPVDIVVIGDSIAEGEGAPVVAKRWTSRMISILRARLGVAGGGVGHVPARYSATSIATEDWTLSNRTAESAYRLGHKSISLLMEQSTGLGDGTATITRTCSSFKLLAHQHPTQATSLFVTVDGGAAVVWDVPAGPGAVRWTARP